MAQRVVTQLIDDIDGGEADETVTFSIDGKAYAIDLSKRNAERLRSALADYVEAGRRLRGAAAVQRRGHAGPNPETQAVRSWAKGQGYDVSDRGRVPQDIWAAYRKAH